MPDQDEAEKKPVPVESNEPVGSSTERPEESPSAPGTRDVAPAEVVAPAASQVEATSQELISAVPAAEPREWYRAAGLAIVAAGLALFVAALVSPGAPFLQRLGNPHVPAGTLIVGGLVLFGVGVLRRALAPVRGEVEYIANQTPLVGQIAEQGRELQREFGGVESALGAAREDMRTLSGFVQQLMELAANPEFETSLFRMAASLDQLGARLDLSIKSQLDAMQERLQEVQQDSRRSSEELMLELKILDEQLQAQDSGRREGELETRARVAAEVVQLEACVARCAEQQLGDLREHVTSVVQASSDRAGGRLDQGMQAIGGVREELDRVHGTLTESVVGLSGEGARSAQELASGLAALNRELRQVVEGQGSSFAGRLERLESALSLHAEKLGERDAALGEQASARAAELTERLDDHRTQLEQSIGTRCDALASDLTAIAELVCELGSSVREASESKAPVAEVTQPEPVDETPEQPLGPRPFGDGVEGKVESSPDRTESDRGSVQAPLPAKEKAPAPVDRPHEYPVERLGSEFDDGWIDG